MFLVFLTISSCNYYGEKYTLKLFLTYKRKYPKNCNVSGKILIFCTTHQSLFGFFDQEDHTLGKNLKFNQMKNICTGRNLVFMYIQEELVKCWNRKNVQYPYVRLLSLDLTKQAHRFSTEFHKALIRRITHTVICTIFSLKESSTRRYSTFVWGSFHVLAFMGTMRDSAHCVLKYPKDCLQNKEKRHTV